MVSKAEAKKQQAAKAVQVNEKKWTKPLMDSGWTAFPSIILEKQATLGLTAMDVNIILYLSTYWWEAENKPHPSKKTIAEALGVQPRTIQRRIAELEKCGFIKREYRKSKDGGNHSNRYCFQGLIEDATPYAQEKREDIEQRKANDEQRRKRKKPKLKSIDGGKN